MERLSEKTKEERNKERTQSTLETDMIDMRAQKKKQEKAGNDTERKHRKHKYI